MSDNEIPIILCCGTNGRAVVFGFVDELPVKGEPITLRRARMVIYWAGSRGLFGVAADGPEDGSRLSPVVQRVTETVWQEWMDVTAEAAERINAWE